MYTLEKISIDEGKSSAVSKGHKTQGDLSVFDSGGNNLRAGVMIELVIVGVQVLLTRGFQFLRTSPITEIIERGEDFVVFHTNTSVYRLERHKED